MKKLACVLSLILLLSGCGLSPETTKTPASPSAPHKSVDAQEVTSFIYGNGGLSYYFSCSVNRDELIAHIASDDVLSDETSWDVRWDEEKFNALISEVLDCGALHWDGDYDGHVTDGDTWWLMIEGSFGTVEAEGNSAYPDGYNDLINVVEKYFPLETTSPPPTPTPTFATAVELAAEAPCPAPKEGDWYEWDIAGNYPGNGSFYYNDESDLLIRMITGSISQPNRLVSSHLDGSGEVTLDEYIEMASSML
jgi:hypothetical protein